MVRITLIAILLSVFISQTGDTKTLISRSLVAITLAMELTDFQKRFPNQEITSSFSLQQGDRVFAVIGKTKSIDAIWCYFYDGRLYKIEVVYSLDYSRKVPWDSLVGAAVKDYGQGGVVESSQGIVATWADEASSLMMEQRVGKEGRPRYVISLLDNAIYLLKGETCSPRRYQA